MKIVPTRRTDYGIRALLHLAHEPGTTVKASAIGEAMDIPPGFLRQILQELQRSGFVISVPGPNGGYGLAVSPEAMTIRDIVEALEGPAGAGECALRGGPCHWEDVCALHWTWSAAREAFAAKLEETTVAQVARDDAALAAGTKPIPADSHRRPGAAPRLRSRVRR